MRITVHPPDRLSWNGATARCALGHGGTAANKREGDGKTPMGTFPLRRVFYRADRVAKPETALPCRELGPDDGWCDDPGHASYNRLVHLPFGASHEKLWRSDGLYDIIVELGYNDDPVEPGRGSAIFLHVAQPGYQPTEGCVALAIEDLLQLLKSCREGDALTVEAAE